MENESKTFEKGDRIKWYQPNKKKLKYFTPLDVTFIVYNKNKIFATIEVQLKNGMVVRRVVRSEELEAAKQNVNSIK